MNLVGQLTASLQQQNDAARKVYGVVTGIVVDIVDPKKLGRVRVNFPDLADMESDGVAIDSGKKRAHSNWARIATLMAGKGRGTYFIPEIDDEVIVAFEHGDLSRPIILGVVWNTKDQPSETMDGEGKNDIRAIHSRSGHKIVLNDSKDKPSIRIGDKKDENFILIDLAEGSMQIKVKKDFTIEAGGNVTVKAGGSITIEAKQDISIETKANLKQKATGKLELESTGPASLKSKANASVEGSAQASVKGATVSVNGSGMTEIKGGLVKIN